jgi:hypothetical protein
MCPPADPFSGALSDAPPGQSSVVGGTVMRSPTTARLSSTRTFCAWPDRPMPGPGVQRPELSTWLG